MTITQSAMRAVVLHQAGDLRIEEVPIPDPGPGELLLAVETVGICGTDAAEYSHGPMQLPIDRRHPVTGHLGPLIPGHEFGGTVAGLGPGVDGFTEGELVASAGSTGCGSCGFCESGRPSRCLRYWAVGLHANGALAEYCTVPAAACLSVGSELTADEAALAQPMAIAVHALHRGRIEGDEDVVVIGAGGIGAFVTYALASAGCKVTAVDLDRGRLDIASALGGTDTIVPGPNFDHTLEAAVVFEITGSTTGLSIALAALGQGGRLVAVGFQKQTFDADFEALTTGEQEWVGTNRIDPSVDLPEAIRLLAARDAPWSDVAPRVLPLDDVEGALGAMARGEKAPIKTLISPRTKHPRQSRM